MTVIDLAVPGEVLIPASLNAEPSAPEQTHNLLHKALDAGRHAVEAVRRHLGFERSIGSVAISEIEAPFSETVKVPGAGEFLSVAYQDDPAQEHNMTELVNAGQADAYKSHNIWGPDAKSSPVRGAHVRILSLLRPETKEPVVSLRKFAGDVRDFPTVVKCAEAGTLDDRAFAEFEKIAQDQPAVEIMSLWKADGQPASLTFAQYKAAMHESLKRGGEVWFMGAVAPELRLLNAAYGPKVVRVVGRQTKVNDGLARDAVRITPAYINTATFFDDLMDQIAEDKASPDLLAQRAGWGREALLWRAIEGLDLNLLSPETRARLENM